MTPRMPFITIFALVTILVLTNTASAQNGKYQDLSQCQELARNGSYIQAGKCYEQFREWGKCVYYLLRGAREYEKEWNRGLGDYEARIRAIQYYDGYSYTCQYAYGDEALIHTVDSYKEWLVNWVSKGGDPPFDMDLFLDTLKKKVFPEKKQRGEEVEGERANATNASQVPSQVIVIEKKEERSVWETVAVVGGTLVGMLVVYLVLWLYFGRQEGPKHIPEYWSIVEPRKD